MSTQRPGHDFEREVSLRIDASKQAESEDNKRGAEMDAAIQKAEDYIREYTKKAGPIIQANGAEPHSYNGPTPLWCMAVRPREEEFGGSSMASGTIDATDRLYVGGDGEIYGTRMYANPTGKILLQEEWMDVAIADPAQQVSVQAWCNRLIDLAAGGHRSIPQQHKPYR